MKLPIIVKSMRPLAIRTEEEARRAHTAWCPFFPDMVRTGSTPEAAIASLQLELTREHLHLFSFHEIDAPPVKS